MPQRHERPHQVIHSASEVLSSQFLALHPMIVRLAQQRYLGGPYRTHLQILLARHIANKLDHSLQNKTGPQSITNINGTPISTADIKEFVTKLQSSTFDNNQSHVNTYRRLFLRLVTDDLGSFASHARVRKFMDLCRELFEVGIGDITIVNLTKGSDEAFERSVRSKSWRHMDQLREAVKSHVEQLKPDDESNQVTPIEDDNPW